MKMKTKEKTGVGIALSFGVFSGVITVFRYVYVSLIYAQDFFLMGYFGFTWMAAEGETSIPALRAFMAERKSRRTSGVGLGPADRTYQYMASGHRSSGKSSPVHDSQETVEGHRPPSTVHKYRSDRDIILSDEWDSELGASQTNHWSKLAPKKKDRSDPSIPMELAI
ncbi:hypothetical protein F5Y15DRAFT_346633 [Xylariaceae sp. FL0016]|nr:hypothetical protein F5Y15DRAFT_346633 [Xylariaceae sp. FL0016]